MLKSPPLIKTPLVPVRTLLKPLTEIKVLPAIAPTEKPPKPAIRSSLRASTIDHLFCAIFSCITAEVLVSNFMVKEQNQFFEHTLRSQLNECGIYLIDYVDLNQEQRQYLQNFFEEQIFPVLTPLAVDPSHPFPYISNLSLNLAVVVKDPDTDEELFARIKVPKVLPRFVALPKELRQHHNGGPEAVWMGIPLEQAIAHNLDALFPGMNVQECHPFRITRNADIAVEEDEADDLLLAIEQELRKRKFGGSAVRMSFLI